MAFLTQRPTRRDQGWWSYVKRFRARTAWGSVGACVLVAALTVTGCSSGSSGGAESSNSATPPPSADVSQSSTSAPAGAAKLRVTTLYVCSESPLAWGMTKGIFKNHGLDVELVRTAGGAAGLAAVMSGSADLSSTNPVSALLAGSQGFPIKIVSGSFNASADGPGASEGVAVSANSPIKNAADLKGKKLAVNELGSANHVLTLAWLRKAGVEPSDVNVLALSFGDMVAAVTSGRVDGAMMTGAQVAALTAAKKARVIGNPLTDVIGPIPIAQYIATDSFATSHKDSVKKFTDALAESIKQVKDPANREEMQKVTSEFCKTPVESLAKVRDVDWTAAVDADVLKKVSAVLTQEKLLTSPYDPGQLIDSGSSS